MTVNSNEQETLQQRALRVFGFNAQLQCLGEELAEAAAAIFRYESGKGSLREVRLELVDVESLLASVRGVIGDDECWHADRNTKAAKLRAKLDFKEGNSDDDGGERIARPSH